MLEATTRGISLHFGLDHVDPTHYRSWDGELKAAENDAELMHEIATKLGYEATLIPGPEANSGRLWTELESAAMQLNMGDILLLTFAGHGAQVADKDGDEPDLKDEAWCMYDRMVLDDELTELFVKFDVGVRIVLVSDSCHSGTLAQNPIYRDFPTNPRFGEYLEPQGEDYVGYRAAPPEIAHSVFLEHPETYGRIQASQFFRQQRSRFVSANLLQLSACEDNQVAIEGISLGFFTRALRDAWREGKFKGDYRDFHKVISAKLPPTQSPCLRTAGPRDWGFMGQKPFTMEPPTSRPVSGD